MIDIVQWWLRRFWYVVVIILAFFVAWLLLRNNNPPPNETPSPTLAVETPSPTLIPTTPATDTSTPTPTTETPSPTSTPTPSPSPTPTTSTPAPTTRTPTDTPTPKKTHTPTPWPTNTPDQAIFLMEPEDEAKYSPGDRIFFRWTGPTPETGGYYEVRLDGKSIGRAQFNPDLQKWEQDWDFVSGDHTWQVFLMESDAQTAQTGSAKRSLKDKQGLTPTPINW